MKLTAGTRLGHYEVVSPIGAGGMGEVYRARDTRLDRTVAVKVLPSEFATNNQLKLRFEREAKVISSLSHPHICTLHDVGSSDGIEFLVMEHLEGETLADRVARGPLPLGEVYRYATEIADALHRAHRVGVVHRDLKPGNIMITKSGAKLLDFGLAKVVAQSTSDLTTALEQPTQHKPLTAEGSILGTFQYMSPEQLEGREPDARSDIFAFGAVLYEMLTGRRAFEGKTRASVIAAILAAEPPPVATLRTVTPAGLDRLVRTCLTKDPDERWQSIHDVRMELDRLKAGESDAQLHSRRNRLPWAIAALCALAAAGAALYFAKTRSGNAPPAIAASLSSPGIEFNTADGPATISPDGTKVVARIRRAGSGAEVLAVRDLASTSFVELTGTEGGYDPFWSPDSRHVGFFRDSKIQRIPVAGGPVSLVCASGGDPRGAAWFGGTILFSPGPAKAIHRVAASGGTPVEALKIDPSRGEIGQWRPQFLGDERHFVFLSLNSSADKTGVYLGDLESRNPPVKVLDAVTTAVYAHPGYLLYAYSGDLYAQPFDTAKMAKTGDARLLAKNVEYSGQFGSAGYSASTNGVLVYHTWNGNTPSHVVAISAQGVETSIGIDGDNLDLARDGTRLAMQRVDTSTRAPDIWVLDLKRGGRTRLTFDAYVDVGPSWSPDGKQVAYVTQMTGYQAIHIRSASASSPATEVTRFEGQLEITDWSPDGRYLIAEVFTEEKAADIYVLDLQGARKLVPLISNRWAEHSPRFSRDGKYIAYQSTESGQQEIYVSTFPSLDQRWQISAGGGSSARWSNDGRLFYLTGDRRLASVRRDPSQPGFVFGPPELGATANSQDITHPSPDGTVYISRDKPASTSIALVTDWQSMLAR